MVRHRLDSIRDCAHAGYNLRITCDNDACGHVVEASAPVMMAELGARRAKLALERLEERMKCQRCGHRGAAISPCHPNM